MGEYLVLQVVLLSLGVSTVETNRDQDQDFSIVEMPFFKLKNILLLIMA
jgi:hypothetical protein